MKCGICHNDSPTFEYESFGSRAATAIAPVLYADELAQHKRQQHPAELKAAQEKRAQGRRDADRAKSELRARVQAVGQQQGRVALQSWDGQEPTITHTSQKYDATDLRYPNEAEFAGYEAHMAAAQDALQRAWSEGSPVPQRDIEAVRKAMEEVT